MLGTISLLLRGLPFIFQGQEIGMTNTNWQSVDEFDDLNTVDQYHWKVAPGRGHAHIHLLHNTPQTAHLLPTNWSRIDI